MPFMVWNDKLSVGVKLIDNDHKKLLGMANHLYDAIAAQRGKQELERILSELVEYTTFHFAREEELFSRTGYPEAARHKIEHDELTTQVLRIQARYHGGSQALTLEVMIFLKDWLFDHILGSDVRFGPHFNAKGVQ
jgi:hemerythrin